ncbi:MAG: gfo/Idh/MocA family oxidoreductase, partial [Clostridia bacterium]|nr:gfo/Idh/MocA family oxidoreductase [Clostridia bacterium]
GGDCIVYHQDGDAGVLCDRTFIEAVINGDGSKIRSPYADAFKSVSFTMACNESMATGKPVKVELE